MRVAYGINLVKNAGSGQTIGIIDAFDDPNIESDFGVFNNTFGLPACTTANGCFKLIYGAGVKPPPDATRWSDEMAVDVEWAHSVAPSAKILLVEAASNSLKDLTQAVDTAVANGATVVSMSYAASEYPTEAQDDTHYSIPNVVFVASSGDTGHLVSLPAASPYVVAVGGTSLASDPATGKYISETAWSRGGGGVSQYEPQPVYQSGYQTSGKRGVPDVSYDGDPSTGVPAYSTWACKACSTGWHVFGGTSIGAPQWAGIFAVANSLRVASGKATLTTPQYTLYPASEAAYHDITTGSNGNCGSVCEAAVGYDFVTGVGSPQAQKVISALYNAN